MKKICLHCCRRRLTQMSEARNIMAGLYALYGTGRVLQ